MTNETKIGQRIRELRLKKGLTQKDLAGSDITRNMLSLIESGSSCPSVGTLMMLAQKLEVPVGYFFTNTPEEEKSYHKSVVIEDLKHAFDGEDYERCSELCSTVPAAYADDEISMIGAISYLKSAIADAEHYALKRAYLKLGKAADYSGRTIYLDESFHRSVSYYSCLFREIHNTDVPDLLTDLTYASPFVPHEMILYFGIIRMAKNLRNVNIPYVSGTVYEKHVEAAIAMNEGKWGRALKLLKELSTGKSLPYFMRYRVLCDLETASNKTGDMRGAYVSARKKLELIQSPE